MAVTVLALERGAGCRLLTNPVLASRVSAPAGCDGGLSRYTPVLMGGRCPYMGQASGNLGPREVCHCEAGVLVGCHRCVMLEGDTAL